MNFREASNSHGVAKTVSFRWSRSRSVGYSHAQFVTLDDGSLSNYYSIGSEHSYGVAIAFFIMVDEISKRVQCTPVGGIR